MKLSKCSGMSEKPRSTQVFQQIRGLFSRADKVKIISVTIIQIGLSILDLISVAFVGLLTALTINGIQSKQPTGTVSRILNNLGISGLEFQQQAAILGFAAGSLLILRTVLALMFNKRLLVFLSIKAAKLSSELIARLLKQPILVIQEKSIQERIFQVTVGVGAITNGVIATGVTLVADTALLIVMFIGLTLVNPTIAISSAAGFGFVGAALYQLLKHRAAVLAINDAGWSIQSNQKLAEVLTSYREATVRNRRDYYSEMISEYRYKMARAQADAMFIPTISKYVIEMSLVMGSLILAAAQFLLFDALHAISILAVFLAAGARVAPAILRLQQGAIQIKTNLAVATETLNLWSRINSLDLAIEAKLPDYSAAPSVFSPNVSLKNVSFRYPGADDFTIKDINLEIHPGEMVAIAGSSGAGKSTLVDLILGVLEPTHGEALLSNIPPSVALRSFTGRISYVPQDVLIVDGTIKSNVALGYPEEEVSDDQVWESLRAAHLDTFVSQLPEGILHVIGERGTNLSGGQRQRLGLARGLFTKPKILVLDEATSALDGQTEVGITEMLLGLRGSITLIVIAHRLSTIRDAERILYLKGGVVAAEGSFVEVENLIPEFGSSTIK
jgi:ABC-type bacteriocin/lantibiotic exporter with double-glycine peptidase domain